MAGSLNFFTVYKRRGKSFPGNRKVSTDYSTGYSQNLRGAGSQLPRRGESKREEGERERIFATPNGI